MKQFNVEIPDETFFMVEEVHEKTGISKKRIVKDALEKAYEGIFGKFRSKNLIKDDSAILNPILTCIFSLALIVIMANMFLPLLHFIGDEMISLGAPAAPILFYYKLEMWGFFVFALAAIIILIASVYKKTHDTGRRNIYR